MTMWKLAAAVAGIFMLMTTPAPAAEGPTYAEKWRPQFHFTSATDWINDPNGLVYFDGEYHLFFQRVPGSNDGNTHVKSWGHAVSANLVRWTQLPDALSPDEAGSIWSGSAVVDWKNTSGFGRDGQPPLIALYTRMDQKDQSDQRLAYSTDRGRTWTKYDKAVLPHIHAINRDPKVIWHEPTQHWIMGLYLDRRHHFALFASPDLKTWEKLHDVTLEADDECPDFFPLALDGDKAKEKWIFTGANGRYVVGRFDGKAFTPETDSIAGDKGSGAHYAAQTYSDAPDGRRIQIAWLRDGKYPGMPFNQQMGFPCDLTLRSTPRGPRLFKVPVPQLASLRGEPSRIDATVLPADKPVIIPAGPSGATEVDMTLDLYRADAVTLDVRGARFTIRREGESASLDAWGRRASIPLADAGKVRLRALIDRTSLELFFEGGETVCSAVDVPADDRKDISLTASGGDARVVSLVAYPLKSAWTQTPATAATP